MDFGHDGFDDDFDQSEDFLDEYGNSQVIEDEGDDSQGQQPAADKPAGDTQGQQPQGQHYEQLKGMLSNYGIDTDLKQYEGKVNSIDDAKAIFKHEMKLAALAEIDPMAAAAHRYGVDANALRQQMGEVKSLLSLDNISLAKDSMYREIWAAENKMGTLPEDQREAEAYVVKLTEERAARMAAKLEAMGKNRRDELIKYEQEIPGKLREVQEKMNKDSMAKFNSTVDTFLSRADVKATIDNGGVIPYNDKKEAEDFGKYAKDMLSYQEGKNDTGLMSKLKDPATMMQVLRLMHAIDKGYFKTLEKRYESKAIQQLDAFGGGGSASSQPAYRNNGEVPI